MQTIYTKENINLNYLSSYVKYTFGSNKLYLYNTLYNKEISIKGDNNTLSELINKLINGIRNEELIKFLSGFTDKPKVLYQYMIRNFIIE